MNPLFNAMGGQAPQNGPAQLAQQFQQFRTNFSGDPRQMTQNLISSGRMTQAQYNQLAQLANQIYPKIKRYIAS